MHLSLNLVSLFFNDLLYTEAKYECSRILHIVDKARFQIMQMNKDMYRKDGVFRYSLILLLLSFFFRMFSSFLKKN